MEVGRSAATRLTVVYHSQREGLSHWSEPPDCPAPHEPGASFDAGFRTPSPLRNGAVAHLRELWRPGAVDRPDLPGLWRAACRLPGAGRGHQRRGGPGLLDAVVQRAGIRAASGSPAEIAEPDRRRAETVPEPNGCRAFR